MSLIRTRWAALGAAVAVTLGGGGIGLVSATNPADATTFIAITPCRVMDTRPEPAFNVGPKSSPVGPDEEHDVTAVGNSGDCTAVPANAAAVSLNVTALNAAQSTFLTIYASNVTRPDASSLNPEPGDPPTPNAVTTELSPGGQFTVFNRFGSVHVIADINGYYVDHNHNDRYYTKAEADAALASKSDATSVYTRAEIDALIAEDGPTAWGMARGDGSLRVQSPNVVEVLHPGTGLYCVVFDPPIGSELEAATISGAGSGPVIGEKTNGIGGPDSCSTAPDGRGLELRIYDESGTLSDERFGFIVP